MLDERDLDAAAEAGPIDRDPRESAPSAVVDAHSPPARPVRKAE